MPYIQLSEKPKLKFLLQINMEYALCSFDIRNIWGK